VESDAGESGWHPPAPSHNVAASEATSGEDIECALAAAERWLAQAQDEVRHSRNLEIGLFTAFAIAVASLLGFGIALDNSSSHSYGMVGALSAILVVSSSVTGAFIMRQLYLSRRSSQFSYRRRVATELATMVEAAYLEVSEREHWSYLRLNTTKLRLEAFPLGEDTMRSPGTGA
jgi:hypothetical protein